MCVKTFNSMAELLAYADGTKSAMPESARTSRAEGRSDFTGVASWPEGTERIEALTAQLTSQVLDRMSGPRLWSMSLAR